MSYTLAMSKNPLASLARKYKDLNNKKKHKFYKKINTNKIINNIKLNNENL